MSLWTGDRQTEQCPQCGRSYRPQSSRDVTCFSSTCRALYRFTDEQWQRTAVVAKERLLSGVMLTTIDRMALVLAGFDPELTRF